MAKRLVKLQDTPPLIKGSWTLQDLQNEKIGSPKNNMKVFSCFHCGGGSTMGYKLAGYTVLGGVEIDSEMMSLYRKNHAPKEELSFLMPVQDFKNIQNEFLPKELFDLDVLDGSPPCSSFSMAGAREDGWDEKKMFREGQTEQILDDLFFHFIEVANKLKPKVVVAENVKGLLMGNARGYVKDIFDAFKKSGYEAQLFLLNASLMGVPQKRERTFFVATRKDLCLPKLELNFNEKQISVEDALKDLKDDGTSAELSKLAKSIYVKTVPGTSFSKRNNGSWFNWIRLNKNTPAPTIPATCRITHYSEPRIITISEARKLTTFPEDYDFLNIDGRYVCGMSVPPLMMQRVASEIYKQLLLPLRKKTLK